MENKWLCSKCEREFPRKFNRDRHEEKNTCEKQYEGEFECVDCNFRSKSRNVLYNHAATDHGGICESDIIKYYVFSAFSFEVTANPILYVI